MSLFKKILFPTDFSRRSDHALKHAMWLANAEAGEVIVQHVVRSYFEKHAHWSTLFDIHEMQKYMDMYVEAEMARVIPEEVRNRIRFRQVISEGQPAQQIIEAAEKEHADLVVMGPARGVVTGQVIRASNRPVLAVPDHGDGTEPLTRVAKILVATDFSPHSKKVVDYAFELKQRLDCEIFLLHSIEMTDAIRFGIRQGHFTDASAKMKTWAENQLKNLTPHQFLGDPTVHQAVDEGPASDQISQAAETNAVDMVVLGAHGYGPIQKHFVGSTTEKLLTKLSRPMLTVKI